MVASQAFRRLSFYTIHLLYVPGIGINAPLARNLTFRCVAVTLAGELARQSAVISGPVPSDVDTACLSTSRTGSWYRIRAFRIVLIEIASAPTIMTCGPVLIQWLEAVGFFAYGSVLLASVLQPNMYMNPTYPPVAPCDSDTHRSSRRHFCPAHRSGPGVSGLSGIHVKPLVPWRSVRIPPFGSGATMVAFSATFGAQPCGARYQLVIGRVCGRRRVMRRSRRHVSGERRSAQANGSSSANRMN